MATSAWAAPLYPSALDDAGVSYTNSTTLTAVSPGAATNPQWLLGATTRAGSILELEAWGTVSTSATTPTLILGFYFGGTAGVILAASSVGLVIANSAAVAWPWRMNYVGRITQNGTVGSITGIGVIENPTSLTAFTARRIPETTAAMTVAIDTSINKAIVVGATWGAAASTNILICNGMKGLVIG